MTTNQEVLERAQSCAQRFEATQEASWLESAWDAIQDVAWTQESSATARGAVRTRSLDMWLHLLDLLDKYLDPNFDENDVPMKLISPPALPGPNAVRLRPGADPALIPDPQLRAEYERAIATNRAKIRNYTAQVGLHRLEGRIRHQVRKFIHDAYRSTLADQEEVKGAIERNIHSPIEKAALLKLRIFTHGGESAGGRH
jgi:hypothetical protein